MQRGGDAAGCKRAVVRTGCCVCLGTAGLQCSALAGDFECGGEPGEALLSSAASK